MDRPELHGNFSSILKDGSDIYRFPTLHMAETHFLLENQSISESSLGILEKLPRSSGLPILKYICVVLFFIQMFWLFIYAAKYIFSWTTIVNSIRIGWHVLNKLELVNLPSVCVRSDLLSETDVRSSREIIGTRGLYTGQ